MRWTRPLLARLFAAFVLAALVAAAPLGRGWISTAVAARSTPDGIRVAGEGWVQAQPDLIRVILGVDVVDASLDTARSEAATRMQGVIDYLRASGIPESDIRTTSLDVSPQYDASGNVRRYWAQNMVEVTSYDVAGSGTLIDGAVGAGATSIRGISFDIKTLENLKTQARDLALDHARANAEKLAREAGVELGPLVAIEEADFGAATTERAPAQAAPAASPAAAAAPIPDQPTQSGMLRVSTDLQMAWARGLPQPEGATEAPGRQEINTVGRGVVIVSPDVGIISLGVDVANPSLPAAWEDAKGRMSSLVQALASAGIPESDVRTTSISLEQQTDRDTNTTWHRVRNVVSVRSADVPGISALVGRAMDAGATRVHSIDFALADRSGPMDRARSLAIENARGKAEQLATRAGVELGRPIAIGTTDTDGARPLRIGAGPQMSRFGTPISPGARDVRTTIRALWAIR